MRLAQRCVAASARWLGRTYGGRQLLEQVVRKAQQEARLPNSTIADQQQLELVIKLVHGGKRPSLTLNTLRLCLFPDSRASLQPTSQGSQTQEPTSRPGDFRYPGRSLSLHSQPQVLQCEGQEGQEGRILLFSQRGCHHCRITVRGSGLSHSTHHAKSGPTNQGETKNVVCCCIM